MPSFTHSPWSGCPLLARNCCGTRGQEQGVLHWRVAACLLAIAISCASSVSPSACANCSSSSQMGQCPLGVSLGPRRERRRPRSSEGIWTQRAFVGGVRNSDGRNDDRATDDLLFCPAKPNDCCLTRQIRMWAIAGF